MNTIIKPLGISMIDWKSYSEVVKDATGIDPIKKLSSVSKDIKDINSFIGSLNLDNDINSSMLDIENQKHVYISFIGLTYSKILGEMALTSDLEIKILKKLDKMILFIISGTLDKWFYSIKRSSTKDVHKIQRNIFNTCYDNLKVMGFKTLLIKRDNGDGSYLIE